MRRRHKRIVAVSRVSILLTFLFLWEFSANTGLIDSFIFSGPSRIALCFLEMTGDGSIFRHIGVTLYETLVSFILVIFFSLLSPSFSGSFGSFRKSWSLIWSS